MSGLVKTELVCPSLWDDPLWCEFSNSAREGDQVMIDIDVSGEGRYEGLFEVLHTRHVYDSETGYHHRVLVDPIEG